jgi:hypothetical protein
MLFGIAQAVMVGRLLALVVLVDSPLLVDTGQKSRLHKGPSNSTVPMQLSG